MTFVEFIIALMYKVLQSYAIPRDSLHLDRQNVEFISCSNRIARNVTFEALEVITL